MPKLYSLEFRQEAVRLLRTSGRPVKLLACELGISPSTLRTWASQLAPDGASVAGLSGDERDELRRLRRQVKVLTEEREILKKAAVFFAQEGGVRP
jgi:transposase